MKISNKGLILPPPLNFYMHWRSPIRVWLMMMMMRRPSSLRVRAEPRHLPYIYMIYDIWYMIYIIYIYDIYIYDIYIYILRPFKTNNSRINARHGIFDSPWMEGAVRSYGCSLWIEELRIPMYIKVAASCKNSLKKPRLEERRKSKWALGKFLCCTHIWVPLIWTSFSWFYLVLLNAFIVGKSFTFFAGTAPPRRWYRS